MIFGLALAGAYSKPNLNHGYRATFRHRDGSIVTISSFGFATPEEARTDARNAAVRLGYRTPKWWEFWRHKENNILLGADVEAEAAKAQEAI